MDAHAFLWNVLGLWTTIKNFQGHIAYVTKTANVTESLAHSMDNVNRKFGYAYMM